MSERTGGRASRQVGRAAEQASDGAAVFSCWSAECFRVDEELLDYDDDAHKKQFIQEREIKKWWSTNDKQHATQKPTADLSNPTGIYRKLVPSKKSFEVLN